MGKQIGQGAYATVAFGLHKESSKKVAIKIYDAWPQFLSQPRVTSYNLMLQYVAVFDSRQMGCMLPRCWILCEIRPKLTLCVFYFSGEVQTLRPTAPEECAL